MFTDTNDKRNMGDLTPFIIQYMEFILEVEKELLEEILKIKSQYDYYTDKLRNLHLSKCDEGIAYYLLLNALFDIEGLTITKLEKISKKSYNTIKKSINNLQNLNILRKTTVGKSKLYEIDLDKLN